VVIINQHCFLMKVAGRLAGKISQLPANILSFSCNIINIDVEKNVGMEPPVCVTWNTDNNQEPLP